MSFLRSVCQVAPAHLLLTGALLHAQLSRSSVEASGGVSPAAAPELDASSLAASVTSVAAKPHALASMARQLEPVVEVLTNLLKQYQVSGNHNGEANTLCALGNAYNSLGQQEKAIDEFQQALAIYRGSGDTNGEASTLSHLGDVYQGWSFPDMAVRFYRRALQTADKATRALVLNNLGVTYLSLSNKKRPSIT